MQFDLYTCGELVLADVLNFLKENFIRIKNNFKKSFFVQ